MRAIRHLPRPCVRWSQPSLVGALSTLTHVDPATRLPRMVDVSAKSSTTRTAVARSVIAFPADAFAVVYRDGVLASKKVGGRGASTGAWERLARERGSGDGVPLRRR